MKETRSPDLDQCIKKEAPQLAALLKEMKDGLDTVRSKVDALTAKVKANNFLTADGISYLEAKHLLLLNYCQSLVYYLLRKAKGLSIEKHPVVRSLVEIRLFLEKIRPIDKKMEYQIQKLIRDSGRAMEQPSLKEKESEAPEKSEDLLNYRPNPDMLVSKDRMPGDDSGVYRPPKIAPSIMEEDKMSRQERNALRREKETLRHAKGGLMKEMIDDMEGRPEEVQENLGDDSREFTRYQQQWEERARREEDLFTRAPITKMEKKKEKQLKKSRDGLLALTDDFYDEIKTLPLEDDIGDQVTSFNKNSSRKLKKQKRRH
ncbi:neuroguidin-B isoform X1 [Ricinus communis]|uniref:neuroguidin-B isoform X1 n=1 Tax=Ricinus communis TaxID=3988 RepID=UPI000772465D|nr:neuroguidin-B isoform X1 [Ricinus communis]XP_048226763.1 neuroguidin-B isoform X1 [Ricinus communis]|eukprot:XP_015579778.1 neuroguidin-B [Ricinus communis]